MLLVVGAWWLTRPAPEPAQVPRALLEEVMRAVPPPPPVETRVEEPLGDALADLALELEPGDRSEPEAEEAEEPAPPAPPPVRPPAGASPAALIGDTDRAPRVRAGPAAWVHRGRGS